MFKTSHVRNSTLVATFIFNSLIHLYIYKGSANHVAPKKIKLKGIPHKMFLLVIECTCSTYKRENKGRHGTSETKTREGAQ